MSNINPGDIVWTWDTLDNKPVPGVVLEVGMYYCDIVTRGEIKKSVYLESVFATREECKPTPFRFYGQVPVIDIQLMPLPNALTFYIEKQKK